MSAGLCNGGLAILRGQYCTPGAKTKSPEHHPEKGLLSDFDPRVNTGFPPARSPGDYSACELK
jgi:hypothetical protein